MAITDILLRSVAHTGLTTKGSEKTFAEEDNNWIQVYEALRSINSGAGLTPYNPSTVYSGTTYVSESGNIYVYIYPSPSSGHTPSSSPTYWQLTSIGHLVHAQNTDQYLDYGGTNQVSAAEIKAMFDDVIFSTPSDFAIAVQDGTLVAKKWYVMDWGYGDIAVYSRGGCRFDPNGMLFYNRATVLTWHRFETTAIDTVRQWSNTVYINITGDNGDDDPTIDNTNWAVYSPQSDFKKYMALACIVGIDYAGSGTYVQRAFCPITRNWFSTSDIMNGLPPLADNSGGGNSSNVMDNEVGDNSTFGVGNCLCEVSNNKISEGSFLSTGLGYTASAQITGNVLKRATVPLAVYDDYTGLFNYNRIVDMVLLTPTGSPISMSMVDCYVDGKSPDKNVYLNRDDDFKDIVYISGVGSNAIVPLNVKGGGGVDFNVASGKQYSSLYGKLLCSSSNSTETIASLGNISRDIPLEIIPTIGLTLTIACTPFGSHVAGCFIQDKVIHAAYGSNVEITGDNAESVIIEPADIFGTQCWRIKQVNKEY